MIIQEMMKMNLVAKMMKEMMIHQYQQILVEEKMQKNDVNK
jgi:hypothetical protein